jgi:murein DD-endopeptidase MepM/ murein hydrolase activator NlpD
VDDGPGDAVPARRKRRAAAVVVVVAVAVLLGVVGDATAAGAAAGAPPGAGAAAGSFAPGGRYWWPLAPPPPAPPPVVVRPFQEPTHRFGPGHRGVDLAAAAGVAVHAAADGVVVFAAALAGRGVVSLQHPDGLRTTYEPVTPLVVPGAHVARGAVLGTLDAGHAGCPTACLHWGVRRDRTTYVDPLVLLAPPRVRLLPVPDPWPDGPAPALDAGRSRDPEDGQGTGAPAGEPVRPGGAPARGPPSAARR